MRGTIGAGNERPYWKEEKTGRRNDTRLPETDNACFRIELMLRTLFLARLLCFTPSPCPSPPSEYGLRFNHRRRGSRGAGGCARTRAAQRNARALRCVDWSTRRNAHRRSAHARALARQPDVAGAARLARRYNADQRYSCLAARAFRPHMDRLPRV